MMFSLVFVLACVCLYEAHEGHHHDISDSSHFKDGGHDTDYDHDAFLGKEHGHDFDTLKPVDAKEKLAKMLPKVDKDGDKEISRNELSAWIEYQRTAFMRDSMDSVIQREDEDGNGEITWTEHKHAIYGKWDDDTGIAPALKKAMKKAKHKFYVADINKDGKLNRDEYMLFRHPEESEDMVLQEIGIDEIIDELDKNEDRVIDLVEFMGQYDDGGDENNPPDWVLEDRLHFNKQLDKDGSGFLERAEIRAWALPDRKEVWDEAGHLIEGSDANRDTQLSYEEVLDHYEMFVGSTATNHGKALHEDL